MATRGISLSDWPIVRMPNGPGIESGDALLGELERDGVVDQKLVTMDTHESIVCILKDEGRGAAAWDSLTEDEKESVQWAVKRFQDHDSEQATDASHDLSWVWHELPDSAELPIYADLIEDPERIARLRSARDEFRRLVAKAQASD